MTQLPFIALPLRSFSITSSWNRKLKKRIENRNEGGASKQLVDAVLSKVLHEFASKFLNRVGRSNRNPIIDASTKAEPLGREQSALGIDEYEAHDRLVVGQPLIDLFEVLRGARERESPQPTQIFANFPGALVDCQGLGLNLDLVAMSWSRFGQVLCNALAFLVVDQFRLLASQVNLSIDGLVNFKSGRQFLRQSARRLGRQEMLGAAAPFRPGLQVVGFAGATLVGERHKTKTRLARIRQYVELG